MGEGKGVYLKEAFIQYLGANIISNFAVQINFVVVVVVAYSGEGAY